MEKIRENWIYVVGFILLLVFAGTCANRQYHRNEGARKELKEQVRSLNNSILIIENRRNSEKDSISKENEKKEQRIKDLTTKIWSSEKKVVALKNQNKLNKERITKLTYLEAAKEFNEVYQTTNAVATDTSVNLQKDLPNRVLKTIDDANTCQDIVLEKDKQLEDKDNIIVEKDSQIKDGFKLLASAETEIKVKNELQAKTDKLVKSTEKSLKAKKLSGVLKTILIPLAFIGGVLIAR